MILDFYSSKSPRIAYLVNGIWNGWHYEIKRKQEKEFYVLLGLETRDICVKLTKYIFGANKINQYLQQSQKDFNIKKHL